MALVDGLRDHRTDIKFIVNDLLLNMDPLKEIFGARRRRPWGLLGANALCQGIAPTLIIIRVGLGISVESTHFGPASRPIAWASHTTDAVSTERYRTGTGALSTTKFDESLELKDVYSRPSAQVSEA